MMILKVLGSVSPYCKGECNCPGYLIHDGETRILLDCGFGVSGELKFPEDLYGLSIFITHYHKDHYSDLFAVKYAVQCYKNLRLFDGAVTLYLPRTAETKEDFSDYQSIVHECDGYFNIVEYGEESAFRVGRLDISFFKTVHSIDNYSIKVSTGTESLIYSGDLGYRNIDEYCRFIQNADLFICESTLLENEGIGSLGHLHTNEVAEIAAAGNVKKLLLTHTWPEHDKSLYLNEVKKTFKEAYAAAENDTYVI